MTEPSEADRIRRAIATGNAVLVTGAGFSHGASDKQGDPLPLGRDLAKQIWPIAFGSEPFEEDASLGEIFRLANQKAGGRLRAHLENTLKVDREKLPSRYLDWFALPWHRIYTLNLDDLDEAVDEKTRHGLDLNILSGINSSPGDAVGRGISVIHLNGLLKDYPAVTFDPPSYGLRTATPDPWYQQFTSDIVFRPTVFVGTVLDEPPIWHYLSQRGSKGREAETRPRSWLVTQNLSASRRELLSGFNINLIDCFEEEFFNSYIYADLGELKKEAEVRRLQTLTTNKEYLVDVSKMIATAPVGSPDFLIGRAPSWGDVLNGYAAEFEWDVEISETVSKADKGIFILHGDPGSGKTTTLLRLASTLAAEGKVVLWLSQDSERTHSQIRRDLSNRKPDYVFIDDIDRFGESGPNFVLGLIRECPDTVFVAASRTHRLTALEYFDRLSVAVYKRAPNLSDNDAIALIGVLDRGHRLGALLGKNSTDRVQAITKRAGRQLLVSLIEATSGKNFHEKIADECRDLTGLQLDAYGVICAARAANGQYLTRDDVLISIDSSNNQGIAALKKLMDGRLVIDGGNGHLVPRHKVVAESALGYFRGEGHLRRWVQMLIFLFAIKYNPNDMTRGRYGKLLIRFLNHDFLRELMGKNADVELIYGAIEKVLYSEFHFWLQRGSFEIQAGNLDPAETFLLQAQALKPDDVKVETSFCYLLMKRALEDPKTGSSAALAREGLRRLDALLQTRPSTSPHTYEIFLTQGRKWLSVADMGRQEALGLRDDLIKYANVARLLFRNSQKIQNAAANLDRIVI